MRTALLAASALAALAASAAPSAAQSLADVTHVASTGDDANACSRAAPCRTLDRAIAATARFGTVKVLDTANYGQVVINKALSLVGEGDRPVLLDPSAATDVTPTVKVAPTYVGDQVSIRNLTFDGGTRARSGIQIGTSIWGSVFISDVTVRNYRVFGVDIYTANPTRVYLENAEIIGNSYGIAVQAGINTSALFMDDCIVEASKTNSLYINGDKAAVALHNSSLAATPVSLTNGGTLVSFGNNFIAGDVGPTSTVALR